MERDLTLEALAYGRHSLTNAPLQGRVRWFAGPGEFRIRLSTTGLAVSWQSLAEHRAPMAPDAPVLVDDFAAGTELGLRWADPARKVGLWTGPW